MLNLNDFSATEQVVLLADALLGTYVVFKILGGLLRFVTLVAVISSLWFVLQPSMSDGWLDSPAVKLLPEVQYAVDEFDKCLKRVTASIGRGGESECKQRAMARLQQSGGAEFASEASREIEAFVQKIHQ